MTEKTNIKNAAWPCIANFRLCYRSTVNMFNYTQGKLHMDFYFT